MYDKNSVSVVLPSYKPDEKLIDTVNGLIEFGFRDIIVIDDGGKEEYNHVFNKVREIDGCTVLVHPENRGKGAALKTAFKWYLENRNGRGVITVDGDGQHRPSDVAALSDKLLESGEIVLGCRDFSKEGIPARSVFGNKFSCGVFRVLVGMKLHDTQTGLRAIPTGELEGMLKVKGDRYEYETNMLLYMKRKEIGYSEVTINTIYIDDNESSHFRPVRDSVRIYSLIFKHIFTSQFFLCLGSSMICYLVDLAMFIFLNFMVSRIAQGLLVTVAAYGGARIASSLLNFYLNRLVFDKQGGSVLVTMVKYYLLVAFNLLVGSLIVHLVSNALIGIESVRVFCEGVSDNSAQSVLESIVKVPVDTALYICSFTVQKHIVFKKNV
ncbi:MAG: glycosyltransferase [Clostridia bacterium]|nr:glycosyltransferase [Clostridia bacterium]